MYPTRDYSHFADQLSINGDMLRFDQGLFEILFVDDNFTPIEIREFEKGEIEYGLFIHDSFPILLLGAAGFEYDFFLNVHALFPGAGQDILQGFSGNADFIIVEPGEFTPIVSRPFIMESSFLQLLKNALIEQANVYKADQAVQKKFKEMRSYLSTREMFDACDFYKSPAIESQ